MARRSDAPRATQSGAVLPVALEFICRINRADVDGLIDLMTADHVLVDSLGQRLRGRGPIQLAWTGYFQMVPGYRVVVRRTLVDGSTVVAVGEARGGCVMAPGGASLGRWRTPAAWRATIRGDRVAGWQIFADNEPIRALMRKAVDSRPDNTIVQPAEPR